MHQTSKHYFVIKLYRFQASSVPIIRSYLLYTRQLVRFMQLHRRCPKHIEFYDKISFGCLMHLVGCFIRNFQLLSRPTEEIIASYKEFCPIVSDGIFWIFWYFSCYLFKDAYSEVTVQNMLSVVYVQGFFIQTADHQLIILPYVLENSLINPSIFSFKSSSLLSP